MDNTKTLIIVPTYNERDNVEIISRRIRHAVPEARLLFIDDNSPDGTGVILNELAEHDDYITVIHRPGKLGIGSAHLDGIARAYADNVSILVTLDADLTHSPEKIHEMIAALVHADVATSSRFEGKGGLEGWNFRRKATTHLGHLLTRLLLRLPYDASSAFRAYKLSNIAQGCFNFVQSTGYSFFFESLKILQLNCVKIVDVPMSLPARTYGSSKMKTGDIWNSLSFLLRFSIESTFRPHRFRLKSK